MSSGDTDHLLFAGKTVSGGSLVLLSLGQETMVATVNIEMIVLGNMLPDPKCEWKINIRVVLSVTICCRDSNKVVFMIFFDTISYYFS